MKVRDLIQLIHRVAPPGLASDWDNSGLQVGTSDHAVSKIALAMDATPHTVQQAIESGCELLLTHHPLIFKPLKNIDFSQGTGRIIKMAQAHGLAIVAAHTNWDCASGGMALALAEALNLRPENPLEPSELDCLKLVVFVPEGHEETLREALFKAGAGSTGTYDSCWFGASGQGGFTAPLDGKPFIGQAGQKTQTSEIRLEMVVPHGKKLEIIKAIFAAHPYEEPAFELHSVKIFGRDQGLGLICHWDQPRNLFEELNRFSNAYKWAGPCPELVKRVALLPGSGGGYLSLAKRQGAEVLITADVSYHQAQEADELGMTVVDLGHFESEWPGVVSLGVRLEAELKSFGADVKCLVLPRQGLWNYNYSRWGG